jgi:hypothetical protein
MKAAMRIGMIAFAALALAGAAMAQPQLHSQDGLSWVSGGITSEERGELVMLLPEHNLKLVTSAERSGAYLTDVGLVILDARGAKVLETRLDGPWFLARLPTGRYELMLTHNGVTQKRVVTIPATGRRDGYFYWKDAASADEPVPEGSRKP